MTTPTGEPVPVRGWRIRTYQGEIRHLHHGWATYRFRTPLYPCDAVDRRRPRDPRLGPAWASQAIASALESFAGRWGYQAEPRRPVFAHVLDYRERPGLVWERPLRGPSARKVRTGFGSRVSEGFGELELLGLVINDTDDHGRPVRR